MIKWIKKNRIETLILAAILLIAAFFRLFRLPEYMTFLGDEGRDMLVIKDLLVNHHLPFIGPPTSIGNIYLGPLYYYMMAVPLTIFWLNPVAAAFQVALISLLTIGLIYYLSREWFGKYSATVAAFLYGISPVNIIYSRSSWNPNPAPFFALLAILGFFKAHRSGNFLWIILTGFSVAAAAQMHYLALILIPIFGLLWLYELSLVIRQKLARKHFLIGTIGAILAFLLLMLPLLIFDLRHNFMNFNALKQFFTNRETTVNVNPFNSLERVVPIYSYNLINRYLVGQNQLLQWITSILVLLPLVCAFWLKYKGQKLRWPYLVLTVWLIISMIGLSLYKQNIYDHYLGFVNPVPFILLGALICVILLVKSSQFKKLLYVVFVILILIITVLNLQINPLTVGPNRQLQRTQDIAKFVIAKSANKPFNFALLAKNNYDSAYQFYLDLYGHKPKQVPFEITDQLFVICEDPICEPINNPKYEIVAFGWGKIETMESFQGVKVFKIIHNPSGKP